MILLSKSYGGFPAGATVQFTTTVEATLVSQGLASVSAGPVTAGAYTTLQPNGRCAIAAGSSSVVITNANITTETKIYAVVAQATADATLVRVERILPAAGSFTIYGTANATATTTIDWAVVDTTGGVTVY